MIPSSEWRTRELGDAAQARAIPGLRFFLTRRARPFVVAGGLSGIRTRLADGVAGLHVWGGTLRVGAPHQNLTVLDGIKIHNPYRLFALTSAFDPETVDRSKRMAGGFGATYGDRLFRPDRTSTAAVSRSAAVVATG